MRLFHDPDRKQILFQDPVLFAGSGFAREAFQRSVWRMAQTGAYYNYSGKCNGLRLHPQRSYENQRYRVYSENSI